MIARMIAVNPIYSTRFRSRYDTSPSTTDPLTPPSPPPPPPAAVPSDYAVFPLKVEDANLGQLGHTEKGQLTEILQVFLTTGLFLSDAKRLPACVGGELILPLKDELCAPVTEKQCRFSPEERSMIRGEISKLLDRGIIRPSKSP